MTDIRAGDVTWRGVLKGQAIGAQFHVRAPGAASAADDWVPGTLELISRDGIRKFGVTQKRASP